MSDIYKQMLTKHCCIGGLHCPCCNDHFGKHKKGLNRLARATLKDGFIKDLKRSNYE